VAKKKPFASLNIINQKRFKNEGFTMKQNTGLDTETYKGYVKLICDDSGRNLLVNNFDDILKFLTHVRFRSGFNWFYNIKFDFESIIKHLDYADLLTLYKERTLEYNAYTLVYLDKKFFSITDNKHKYYFFDMFNFLETSLNKASEKYLYDKKLDIINSSKLNTDLQYWQENYENIIKYCIKDAELTKRLADYFWNIVYSKMNYYPKRPFSKGKIAEEYFLASCYIPTINSIPESVLEYAYNSYFGGRFELLKKGYFEKVYSYDIKSAYPKQISELIDFSHGYWIQVDSKNNCFALNKEAYTGFYQCKIDCNETFFSPFIYKIGELNIFPNGKFTQYLTKQEIDFIFKNFENSDIKIIKGYEFYPETLNYPFKEEIERLYAWKEKEKDEDVKYAVKIFMNALYGKFIQVSGEQHRTGKIFNPIYAALITALTRIKLLELALQSPDDTIMFSTDAVHSLVPLQVLKEPQLGDFSKDFEGEGVYIMSDIYNLWNYSINKTKNKLRGFSLATEKDISSDIIMLKDILSNMQTEEYKYTSHRPYHLGECLLHTKKRSIDDLNVFGEVEKSIKVNGDKKRHWFDTFSSGKECLKKSINSIPLKI
jgi:hypothetical protein